MAASFQKLFLILLPGKDDFRDPKQISEIRLSRRQSGREI